MATIISNGPVPKSNRVRGGPNGRVPKLHAGVVKVPNSPGAQHKSVLWVSIRPLSKRALPTAGPGGWLLPYGAAPVGSVQILVRWYRQLQTALMLPMQIKFFLMFS